MKTMITENLLTFKELEKKVYKAACELAAQTMQEILEEYDRDLMVSRDKAQYRHKGYRQTSAKTVFGEVTFRRAVYKTKDEDGILRFVHLLDDAVGLVDGVGLLSENLLEKIVVGITSKSYRDCAKEISETTGQSISAMGVWNAVQAAGERVIEEEAKLVELHEKGQLAGEKTVGVLFEESDGVNIRLQGRDRERSKSGGAEMKVAIAYDGWAEEGINRYRLDGKVVFAGFMKSKDFHKVREAKIAKVYNTDEAKYRILNGDGANWIKKVPDKDTIFQLDIFHRNKAIKEHLRDPEMQASIRECLGRKDIEGMFRLLQIYEDSMETETEAQEVRKLTEYFRDNQEGLIPYSERGLDLPESPEGLVYRNMGTMENHVWSVAAKRMKHNHCSWSKKGANRLAKILAKKCEGKLGEVVRGINLPVFEEKEIEETIETVFSAAKTPLRAGCGYEYPNRGSVVILNEAVRGDGTKLFAIAGY